MRRSRVVARLIALALLAIPLGGCAVIGGIFKTGFWTGAIAVIVVLIAVMFIASKVRR